MAPFAVASHMSQQAAAAEKRELGERLRMEGVCTAAAKDGGPSPMLLYPAEWPAGADWRKMLAAIATANSYHFGGLHHGFLVNVGHRAGPLSAVVLEGVDDNWEEVVTVYGVHICPSGGRKTQLWGKHEAAYAHATRKTSKTIVYNFKKSRFTPT
jgi:hypothetical protein